MCTHTVSFVSFPVMSKNMTGMRNQIRLMFEIIKEGRK